MKTLTTYITEKANFLVKKHQPHKTVGTEICDFMLSLLGDVQVTDGRTSGKTLNYDKWTSVLKDYCARYYDADDAEFGKQRNKMLDFLGDINYKYNFDGVFEYDEDLIYVVRDKTHMVKFSNKGTGCISVLINKELLTNEEFE